MEFREITLLDQEPIGALRAAAGHVTSSHAFVSLYLWRKTLSLSVAYRRNAFLVRMGEKSDFFFPCGEREDVLSLLSEIFSEQKDARFFYARKEDLLLASHLSEKGSSESFFTASGEEKADTRHLLTARRTPEAREYLYDRAEQIAMLYAGVDPLAEGAELPTTTAPSLPTAPTAAPTTAPEEEDGDGLLFGLPVWTVVLIGGLLAVVVGLSIFLSVYRPPAPPGQGGPAGGAAQNPPGNPDPGDPGPGRGGKGGEEP